MYTCDLHLKGETTLSAKYNLEQAIKICKKTKDRVLCVIVGYGSSGGSSKIKNTILDELEEKKKSNVIKEYISGNELDMFNVKYMELKYKDLIPIECKKRLNPGEIIIIL